MMGRAHAAVGAAAGAAATFALSRAGVNVSVVGMGGDALSSVCIGAVAGAVGGLFPDVDSKGSTINDSLGKIAAPAAIVILAVAIMFKNGTISLSPEMTKSIIGVVAIAICIVGGHLTSHRGFTHSIASCCIYTVGCYLLFGVVIAAISFAGYASHLAIDLLNKKGEQLFFPSQTRIALGLFKASGFANNFTMMAGYVLTAAFVLLSVR